MIVVRISQGREDLAAHPEIRVRHMFAFNRFGQAERDPAKVGNGHRLGHSRERDES